MMHEASLASDSMKKSNNEEIAWWKNSPSRLILRNIPNKINISIGDLDQNTILATANILDDTELRGEYPYNLLTVILNDSLNIGKPHCISSRPFTQNTLSIGLGKNDQGLDSFDNYLHEFAHRLLLGPLPEVNLNVNPVPVEPGTELTFWVEKNAEPSLVTATCLIVGEQCYIFVENEFKNPNIYEALTGLANFFDQTVYPMVTCLFGEPSDTDGDPHIFVLLTQLPREDGEIELGYFHPRDKVPCDSAELVDCSQSNQHDLLYLNISLIVDDELEKGKDTLAHEFQHMINFDHHRMNGQGLEQQWLNESLSELAGFICTRKCRNEVEAFLREPASLTIWTGSLKNYAASHLFGIYLYDRFYCNGRNLNLMRNLVKSKTIGIKNVEQQTGIDFNTLFKEWNAALYLSDTGLTADPAYQYSSINLRAPNRNLDGLQPFVMSDWIWQIQVQPYTPLLLKVPEVNIASAIAVAGTDAGGLLIAHI